MVQTQFHGIQLYEREWTCQLNEPNLLTVCVPSTTIGCVMYGPNVYRVFRALPRPRIDRIKEAVRAGMREADIRIESGARIAVAVGSRGIANLPDIVGAVIAGIRAQGGVPFVVPAMGSHGGGTASGQRKVLQGYGITESAVGAPIVSSMAVERIPSGGLSFAVYVDRNVCRADGVVLVNRVKTHTDFSGPIESGLMKMMAIGLGKKRGAEQIHRFGIQGLRDLIVPTARQILAHCNVRFAVAVVENAYGETALVRVLRPTEIESEEKRLLEIAKTNMPSLPARELDILIVDEFGKDVSGTGVDTKTIGRIRIPGVTDPASPEIGVVILRGLTEASHGNALGMGLADIITTEVVRRIDFVATAENTVTSTFLERGRMPIVARTDRRAVEYAKRMIGVEDWNRIRLMRIRNTLALSELFVSENLVADIRDVPSVELRGGPFPLIDEHGGMIPW